MTSQINPNNINGNYPVPGVPNSSQGMRDNFNNTKTNFQYAANEITELQTNSVFKAALAGTTLDNNMNDNLIYAVHLSDVSWKLVTLTSTSGTVTLDYSAGNFYVMPSQTGNTTLAFSNWPTTGTQGVLRFRVVVSNLSYTLTLPAAVSLGIANIDGISPGTPGLSNTITFPATGTYDFEFSTNNGGTTVSIQSLITPTAGSSNQVVISNTTPSTSTTTGALIVAGGVGVAGNVNAGAFYGDGQYLSNIYANYVFNGNSYVGIGTAGGNANISVGGTANVVVVTNSQVRVNGTGGLALTDGGTMGYAPGAGGTASQSGNKSGGVTINKPSGEITMQNTNLASDTTVTFTLTNSTIANTDVMVINQVSAANAGGYVFNATCNAGNATINVRNVMTATAGDAIVLRYAVIKGATA